MKSVHVLTWQPLLNITFLFLLAFTNFETDPNPAGCLES